MTDEQLLLLEDRVENILAELRPMIAMHQGDARLVEITPEGVVNIEFGGACVSCGIADVTLNQGLKESIMLQCPEVTDVVAVNMPNLDQPETLTGPADSPVRRSPVA